MAWFRAGERKPLIELCAWQDGEVGEAVFIHERPMTMKSIMPIDVCALTVRVLLGCWFVFSGGMKIFGSGLDRFTRDVANYKIVGPPLDALAAYTVPWFEIAAGLCLMLGILRRGAILTLAGMVVVFAFCIGWAWVHQLDISCGCHGGDAPIHYWGKAAEFAGYFLVLGWLWWVESRSSGSGGLPSSLKGAKPTEIGQST